MATHDASPSAYCPYEVMPLPAVIAGDEKLVDSAFGALRSFRTGLSADGATADHAHGGTVFLHGVHDDMDSWSALVRAAGERGTDLGPALFLDLPGFGGSENRRGRLDVAEVGDAVLAATDHLLGSAPVRVVGHSMGTLVAAHLAVRHPERVRSLHLVAGPYYSLVDTMNGRFTAGLPGAIAGGIFGSQYLLARTGRRASVDCGSRLDAACCDRCSPRSWPTRSPSGSR